MLQKNGRIENFAWKFGYADACDARRDDLLIYLSHYCICFDECVEFLLICALVLVSRVAVDSLLAKICEVHGVTHAEHGLHFAVRVTNTYTVFGFYNPLTRKVRQSDSKANLIERNVREYDSPWQYVRAMKAKHYRQKDIRGESLMKKLFVFEGLGLEFFRKRGELKP